MEQNKYNIRISELAAMKQILNVSYDAFFEGVFLDGLKNDEPEES